MIIFLDYDGVMHAIGCESDRLFHHAERFAAVLRDHPDVDVVVSSDWRKDATLSELVAHFPADVRNRFIDNTAVDCAGTQPLRAREAQCCAWLLEHGRVSERWIALEDCPDNFGPDLPGKGAVLFTDPSVGFDDEASLVLCQMIHTEESTTRFLYDRAFLRGWTLWD